MRKSVSTITFIIILIIGLGFYGAALYGIQKSEWKGTIEKENEITIIKNPKEPLYGEIKFDLEQDLSLGNLDDNNYSFKRIGNIQVDKNGILYVLDSDNFRIQVFDKKGKYLQTIGIQGKKSGEFENPQHILVDETTGSIYVKDRFRSIETFDLYGYHLWTVRLDRNVEIGEYYVDEDGNIIGALKIDSESGVADTISKIDRYGEILAHYVEHPTF